MRYILAGAKFGLTANAAFFTFAMLYAVQEAVLKRIAKRLEEMTEDMKKSDKDISDVNPDTSDDLK